MWIKASKTSNRGAAPWPPQIETTGTSVKVRYLPETLPTGYTDKFYIAKNSLTLSNYGTLGTYKTSNNNPSATDITITGLEQDQSYFILGVRFDAGNQPTSVTSNCELIFTACSRLRVTPPNYSKIADWNSDCLFDWFHADGNAELFSAHIAEENSTKYLRIANEADLRTGDGYFINVASFNGINKVSPRWDFEVITRFRHTYDGYGQQFGTGFTSGGSNVLWHEYFRHHGVYNNGRVDEYLLHEYQNKWPEAWTPFTQVTGGSYYGCLYASIDVEDIDYGPDSSWRMSPSASHPDGENWEILPNIIAESRMVYDAANYKVDVYRDNNLLSTLGDTFQPLTHRIKYPAGEHYPLPVNHIFLMQDIVAGTTEFHIFDLELHSSCPYEYCGWSLQYHHHAANYGVVADESQNYYDLDAMDITKVRTLLNWAAPGSLSTVRYDPGSYSGITIPSVETPTWDLLILSWDEQHTFVPNVPVYIESPFYHITPGRKAYKHAYQGYCGTGNILKARLLDQDNEPITDWVSISSVNGNPLLDVPANTATKVRVQVWMEYKGTGTNNMVIGVPMLFVGAEIYSIGTVVSRVGNEITLESWVNATIYADFDTETPTTERTSGEAFVIPEGAETLYFYAEDAGYTEDVQSFSVAVTQIKRINGEIAGVLKKLNGATSGTIKRLINGSWN